MRMKKIFLFVSIGLTLLAIPFTVFVVGQNQEVRKRAAPASTLALAPSTITKKVGDTFSVEAKIDTGTNQVGVIQIRIVYDPAKLQALDITNGVLAPSISVSGKIDPSGKASITVGAKNNIEPITGSGTVAILTMKAIAASASPISVHFTPLPDTYANALGEQNNVLIGTTQTAITILNADGTPADPGNEVPQVTPTLTTVTLTPTPTATHSGTPRSTVPVTRTPTPTIIQNQDATPSAVTIDSIEKNEEITTTTPVFSGTAPTGTTVTLTIYSEPRTVVVTVDENGNWTYTPEVGLEPGPHTVTAMVSDPITGQTSTASVPFVLGDTTETELPVSGNIEITFALITLGILFMFSGILIPVFIH